MIGTDSGGSTLPCRIADRLERAGGLLLRAGVLGMPLLAIAGIFALTAGTDESFLLLHVRGLVEHGRIGEGSGLHSSHTLSTSGLYTVAAGVLHWIGGGSLPVIRLLGPLSLAGLIVVLLRLADRTSGRTAGDRWMVPASLLLVHGTALLSSQAYGEILATALVLLGILLWAECPPGSWRRRLGVGVLLGTATATRLNCFPAFLALAVTLLGSRPQRRTELRDGLLTAGIGILVFACQWGLYVFLAHDPLSPAEWREDFGMGKLASVSWAYSIPKRLGFFEIGHDHLPLFVLVGITAGWGWARGTVADARAGDGILAFGWLEGLAWLLQAPAPHLRYLWPALAAFAAVAGLSLAAAFRTGEARNLSLLRRGALAVVLACILSGTLDGARLYLHGESDLLSWEYQRWTPQTLQYGPFKHQKAQRAVVRRLRDLPPGDEIATFTMDASLAYLTRRPIFPILWHYAEPLPYYLPRASAAPAGRLPRWLVVTPMVNRFPDTHLPPDLHAWIRENCRLEAREGPYLLYEVRGAYPSSPRVFHLDPWEPRLPLAD